MNLVSIRVAPTTDLHIVHSFFHRSLLFPFTCRFSLYTLSHTYTPRHRRAHTVHQITLYPFFEFRVCLWICVGHFLPVHERNRTIHQHTTTVIKLQEWESLSSKLSNSGRFGYVCAYSYTQYSENQFEKRPQHTKTSAKGVLCAVWNKNSNNELYKHILDTVRGYKMQQTKKAH